MITYISYQDPTHHFSISSVKIIKKKAVGFTLHQLQHVASAANFNLACEAFLLFVSIDYYYFIFYLYPCELAVISPKSQRLPFCGGNHLWEY